MTYKLSWSNRFEIKPGRWVYNPTLESRNIGQQIIKLLNKSWKKPSYYYHLRNGGHVEALCIHQESRFFATLDITDFFGSISRSRITRSLKPIVGYDAARKIAKNSTIKATENHPHSHQLPYGFNQSPILASICLFSSSLGCLLERINKDGSAIVSVYMDDIVVSSQDEHSLNVIFENIKTDAGKSRFLLNESKTKTVANKTEAFNIVLSHRDMRIEYDRFVKFQYAYSASKSGAQKHGIGSYVGSVNKQQAKLLI